MICEIETDAIYSRTDYWPCYFVLGIHIRKLIGLPKEILHTIDLILSGENEEALEYILARLKKAKIVSKLYFFRHTAKLIAAKTAYELGMFQHALDLIRSIPNEWIEPFVANFVANSAVLCHGRLKKVMKSERWYRMCRNVSRFYYTSLGITTPFPLNYSLTDYISYYVIYLYSQNKILAAMIMFKQIALQLHPIEEVNILFSEAVAYYHTGDYDQAFCYITWILDFSHPRVLDVMHRVPVMHYYRGMIMMNHHNDFESGQKSLMEAVRLGCSSNKCRYLFGMRLQRNLIQNQLFDVEIKTRE